MLRALKHALVVSRVQRAVVGLAIINCSRVDAVMKSAAPAIVLGIGVAGGLAMDAARVRVVELSLSLGIALHVLFDVCILESCEKFPC